MPLVKLGLVLAFLLGAQVAAAATTPEKIHSYVSPYAKVGQFSGVLLVMQNGKIIYEKPFGMADAEMGVANSPNMRFGIASVTKLMTSVIRESLAREGIISESDPVSKYIAGFPEGDRITIDMLARHRSGIPHRVTSAEQEAVPTDGEQIVQRISSARLAFAPGTGRLYSSAGYSLLARIFEIASGKSYSQLLRQYVFVPAKMDETIDYDREVIVARRSRDYLLGPDGVRNAPPKDYSYLLGAGSVYSTARDLLKFGQAVLSGSYGEAIRSRLAPEGVLNGNGFTNGHRAYVMLDSARKSGLILVSNLNSGANDLIIQNVTAILAGQEPVAPVIPQPAIAAAPPANLALYSGSYRPKADAGLPIDLDVRGGFLRMGDYKLYPTVQGCFFEYQFYGEMCFSDGGSGTAELRWRAATFTGTWIKQPPSQ